MDVGRITWLLLLGLLAGCASADPLRDRPQRQPAAIRIGSGPPLAWNVKPAPTQRIARSNSDTYRVRPGDTLWAIAVVHGVDVEQLAAWNKVSDPDLLYLGQQLRLTPPPGDQGRAAAPAVAPPLMESPVVESATLPDPPAPVADPPAIEDLAPPAAQAQAQVQAPTIVAHPAPPAAAPTPAFVAGAPTLGWLPIPEPVPLRIPAGSLAKAAGPGPNQTARLAAARAPAPAARANVMAAIVPKPNEEPVAPPEPAAPPEEPAPQPLAQEPEPPEEPALQQEPVEAAPPAQSDKWIVEGKRPGKWLWPVKGSIISGFGTRGRLRNNGIDIAVNPNTPVQASGSGVVAYADDSLAGYGNMIIVRHGGGYMTAYAHNSRILVKRGERVKAGQVIAYSGQSGSATTPRLHFELRKNIKPVNPVGYLAGRM
ncbi:MAG: peptidoglycan DD-metalloendopeptidase family protein [Magnetococcales bacterium]|nr:peptidoglycan DD-metalloendopeptidase family protein [Magnetococcales bacterium]